MSDRRKIIYTPRMTSVTLSFTLATLESTRSVSPLTLSSTACVVLRFSAIVIQDCSCVSLSSLFSASSISVLPISLFPYFSEQPSVTTGETQSYKTTHSFGLALSPWLQSQEWSELRPLLEQSCLSFLWLTVLVRRFLSVGKNIRYAQRSQSVFRDFSEYPLLPEGCTISVKMTRACYQEGLVLKGEPQLRQKSPFQVRISVK